MLSVRYRAEDFELTLEAAAHRFEGDGVFVPTSAPRARSEVLSFEIRSDANAVPLEGVVVVRWSRRPEQAGPGRPAGMSIKFIHFDEPELAHDVLLALRLASDRAGAWEALRTTPQAAPVRRFERPGLIFGAAALAAILAAIGAAEVGRGVLEGSSAAATATTELHTYAARLVSSHALTAGTPDSANATPPDSEPRPEAAAPREAPRTAEARPSPVVAAPGPASAPDDPYRVVTAPRPAPPPDDPYGR